MGDNDKRNGHQRRGALKAVSIGSDDQRRGAALLADQSPRDRMNVYAAVAPLLHRPHARSHPFATLMRWNDPNSPDPFAYALDEFDDRLHRDAGPPGAS